MRVLGIDTSAGASVAIVIDGETCGSATVMDQRAHAEELAVALKMAVAAAGFSSLSELNLDLIAVGTGPAPFTGLRAGLVTARTLGFALGTPVAGVCSLAGLARAALDISERDARVLVVTDAKRREVYCAQYVANGPNDVECVAAPTVLTPQQAANVPAEYVVVGAGAQAHPELFPTVLSQPRDVDAAQIARIAEHRWHAGKEQSTEPLYLRRPDIHPGNGAKRGN